MNKTFTLTIAFKIPIGLPEEQYETWDQTIETKFEKLGLNSDNGFYEDSAFGYTGLLGDMIDKLETVLTHFSTDDIDSIEIE